jgi:hypothetical protein
VGLRRVFQCSLWFIHHFACSLLGLSGLLRVRLLDWVGLSKGEASRFQTAGQDAPDGVSWGYGHKSSDLTQLAALRHLCNRQASPWNVKFLFLFSVLLIG